MDSILISWAIAGVTLVVPLDLLNQLGLSVPANCSAGQNFGESRLISRGGKYSLWRKVTSRSSKAKLRPCEKSSLLQLLWQRIGVVGQVEGQGPKEGPLRPRLQVTRFVGEIPNSSETPPTMRVTTKKQQAFWGSVQVYWATKQTRWIWRVDATERRAILFFRWFPFSGAIIDLLLRPAHQVPHAAGHRREQVQPCGSQHI